ncbi:MAG: winged helix-turn-helix transcriptional regulator [Deltaproteobacteria bacterium]|nr:winged helix-turn-helix transcriptional regulator [Deltaproteobacteria bacterium]
MKKTAVGPCVRCEKRDRCRVPCAKLASLLAEETHHLQGREILVGPATMNLMLTNERVTALADMTGPGLRRRDLDEVPGLTDLQRRVLAMAVVDRRTQRQIAGKLGLSQSTVHEHMAAARRKVRNYLEAKSGFEAAPSSARHLDAGASSR